MQITIDEDKAGIGIGEFAQLLTEFEYELKD